MSTDPYDEIISRAKNQLSNKQQQRLVEELSQHAARKNGPRRRRIPELEELGAEIWQGIDPDEYVANATHGRRHSSWAFAGKSGV